MTRSRALRRRLWAGVLVVVALVLLTVALGGFRRVEAPGAATMVLGEPFDLGPYRLTVTGAEVVPHPFDDSVRQLRVAADVETTGDTFVTPTQLVQAVRAPTDAGLVPGEDGSLPDAELQLAADDSFLDVLNPGLTYDVVLAWDQSSGWAGDAVTLELTGFEWVEEDRATLQDRRWRYVDDVQLRVTVPVSDGGAA